MAVEAVGHNVSPHVCASHADSVCDVGLRLKPADIPKGRIFGTWQRERGYFGNLDRAY